MATLNFQLPERKIQYAPKGGREVYIDKEIIDLMIGRTVASRSTTAPPGAPTNGLMHIIPPGATGVWATKTNQLTFWLTTLSDGVATVWGYAMPQGPGYEVWCVDEAKFIYWNGSAWVDSPSGGGGGATGYVSAGASSMSLGTLVLSNGGGVSFGLSNGSLSASVETNYQTPGAYLTTAMQSNAVTMSNMRMSAGTITELRSGITFTDGPNGVSFGFNSLGVLSASVQTNYQTPGAYLTTAQPVGAYLTTARASNDALGLGTAGTNVTWTANSAGLSLNAAGYAGTGFTSGATAGASIVGTHGSNGLSLGIPAFLTTAQAPGAYLTTARASTDALGLATAGTNMTWTANSAGVSINAGGYAGTGFTSTTTAGVAIVGTHNTAGLSLGVPAIITTAALSNHSHGNPTLALTNLSGTTASASNGLTISLSAPAAGTAPAGSISAAGQNFALGNMTMSNSNNVSFGMAGGVLTASASYSAEPAGTIFAGLNSYELGGLTFVDVGPGPGGVSFGLDGGGNITANIAATYAGIGFTTGTTGGSVVAGTHNSLGLSLRVPAFLTTAQAPGAYLTTARASNDAIGLGTAQTNVTWTANSAGLSLNAGGYAGTGFTATTTAGTDVVGTHNTAGLSMGIPAFITTAAQSNHSHGNPTLALTNLSGTTASASNGFTLSLAAAAPGGGVTLDGYNPFPAAYTLVQAGANGSVSVMPINMPQAVQMDRGLLGIHCTNATNSSGQHSLTYAFGLYTKNASTLSLLYSGSVGYSITHSGTAGSYSLFSGVRMVTMSGAITTIPAGNYWLGVMSSRLSAVANGSYSQVALSQVNTDFSGLFNVAGNATIQSGLGRGVWTAATATMPNSMAFSDLQGTNNAQFRFPVVSLQYSTV